MSRSKSNVAALVACSVLGLAGCNDDSDLVIQQPDAGVDGGALQPVTINFKAKVGGEDLVCGRTYAGQGASQVAATPQDFRFFVQEVYLLDASGKEVRVELDDGLPFQNKEVALIDFTNDQGNCGGTGGSTVNLKITGHVPAGSYNGVVLVNGVPETLNHANPALAKAPLQAPGASWDWTGGYRFVMAELAPSMVVASGMDGGVHMPAGDGDGGVADAGVGGHGGNSGVASSIHVGSTGCSGNPNTAGGITCTKQNRNRVKLTGFNPTTQTIVADLSAVFAGIDISTAPQCHGMGATCAPGFAAFGVDFASGQPAATQTVFHVE